MNSPVRQVCYARVRGYGSVKAFTALTALTNALNSINGKEVSENLVG